MAQKNLIKFFELVNKDDKLREEFKNVVSVLKDENVSPEKVSDTKRKIVSLGKKYGFNFTENEFVDSLKEASELSLSDLDNVAGGFDRRATGGMMLGVLVASLASGAILMNNPFNKNDDSKPAQVATTETDNKEENKAKEQADNNEAKVDENQVIDMDNIKVELDKKRTPNKNNQFKRIKLPSFASSRKTSTPVAKPQRERSIANTMKLAGATNTGVKTNVKEASKAETKREDKVATGLKATATADDLKKTPITAASETKKDDGKPAVKQTETPVIKTGLGQDGVDTTGGQSQGTNGGPVDNGGVAVKPVEPTVTQGTGKGGAKPETQSNIGDQNLDNKLLKQTPSIPEPPKPPKPQKPIGDGGDPNTSGIPNRRNSLPEQPIMPIQPITTPVKPEEKLNKEELQKRKKVVSSKLYEFYVNSSLIKAFLEKEVKKKELVDNFENIKMKHGEVEDLLKNINEEELKELEEKISNLDPYVFIVFSRKDVKERLDTINFKESISETINKYKTNLEKLNKELKEMKQADDTLREKVNKLFNDLAENNEYKEYENTFKDFNKELGAMRGFSRWLKSRNDTLVNNIKKRKDYNMMYNLYIYKLAPKDTDEQWNAVKFYSGLYNLSLSIDKNTEKLNKSNKSDEKVNEIKEKLENVKKVYDEVETLTLEDLEKYEENLKEVEQEIETFKKEQKKKIDNPIEPKPEEYSDSDDEDKDKDKETPPRPKRRPIQPITTQVKPEEKLNKEELQKRKDKAFSKLHKFYVYSGQIELFLEYELNNEELLDSFNSIKMGYIEITNFLKNINEGKLEELEEKISELDPYVFIATSRLDVEERLNTIKFKGKSSEKIKKHETDLDKLYKDLKEKIKADKPLKERVNKLFSELEKDKEYKEYENTFKDFNKKLMDTKTFILMLENENGELLNNFKKRSDYDMAFKLSKRKLLLKDTDEQWQVVKLYSKLWNLFHLIEVNTEELDKLNKDDKKFNEIEGKLENVKKVYKKAKELTLKDLEKYEENLKEVEQEIETFKNEQIEKDYQDGKISKPRPRPIKPKSKPEEDSDSEHEEKRPMPKPVKLPPKPKKEDSDSEDENKRPMPKPIKQQNDDDYDEPPRPNSRKRLPRSYVQPKSKESEIPITQNKLPLEPKKPIPNPIKPTSKPAAEDSEKKEKPTKTTFSFNPFSQPKPTLNDGPIPAGQQLGTNLPSGTLKPEEENDSLNSGGQSKINHEDSLSEELFERIQKLKENDFFSDISERKNAYKGKVLEVFNSLNDIKEKDEINKENYEKIKSDVDYFDEYTQKGTLLMKNSELIEEYTTKYSNFKDISSRIKAIENSHNELMGKFANSENLNIKEIENINGDIKSIKVDAEQQELIMKHINEKGSLTAPAEKRPEKLPMLHSNSTQKVKGIPEKGINLYKAINFTILNEKLNIKDNQLYIGDIKVRLVLKGKKEGDFSDWAFVGEQGNSDVIILDDSSGNGTRFKYKTLGDVGSSFIYEYKDKGKDEKWIVANFKYKYKENEKDEKYKEDILGICFKMGDETSQVIATGIDESDLAFNYRHIKRKVMDYVNGHRELTDISDKRPPELPKLCLMSNVDQKNATNKWEAIQWLPIGDAKKYNVEFSNKGLTINGLKVRLVLKGNEDFKNWYFVVEKDKKDLLVRKSFNGEYFVYKELGPIKSTMIAKFKNLKGQKVNGIVGSVSKENLGLGYYIKEDGSYYISLDESKLDEEMQYKDIPKA